MQIHEVFGLGAAAAGTKATAGAMFRDPKSFVDPTKYAQAKQTGYAASAAKSAEKLRAKGYGTPEQPQSVDQLIVQVQNDQPAQQLINSWATQWPKLAANIPQPATAPATAPARAPAAQSMDLDQLKQQADQKRAAGIAAQKQALQQIKSTSDAHVSANSELAGIEIAARAAAAKSKFQQTATDRLAIKRAKDKGINVESTGLSEQEESNPTYRAAFVSWANGVVERTIRQSGVLTKVKQQPGWEEKFEKALTQVVDTAANAQQNDQAVKQYLSLALAAARAAQQDSGPQMSSNQNTQSQSNIPRTKSLAQAAGIDDDGLAKLNAFIRRNGERINPNGTGSPSLDALLKSAKLL